MNVWKTLCRSAALGNSPYLACVEFGITRHILKIPCFLPILRHHAHVYDICCTVVLDRYVFATDVIESAKIISLLADFPPVLMHYLRALNKLSCLTLLKRVSDNYLIEFYDFLLKQQEISLTGQQSNFGWLLRYINMRAISLKSTY